MSKAPTITPMMYRMLPWIAAMAFFMQSLDTSILNTALPAMARDLNESPLNMQSAVISYALTLALFIPISGFLADRFGTQRMFVLAVFLFTVGSLLCAMSHSLLILDISRVVQGIGGSMMTPISRLVLIKAFDRSQFLAALNASTLPGAVGPIIGPVIGGYLVDIASWHWIFLINLPVGLLGIIMGLKYIPNFTESKLPFDFWGFCMVAIAVVLATLSLEFLSKGGTLYLCSNLLLTAMLLICFYIFHAQRAKHALFPLPLFSIRTFRLGVSGSLVSRIGISAAPLLIPLLLQLAFGYSSSQAGLMLMSIALGSIVMKTQVQWVLRCFGYRRVLMANTLFVGALIAAMSLLQHNSSVSLICVMLFALGMANSLQFTSMNSLTLADLQGDLTSSGNSLMAVNQQLAISFGVSFGAALVRIFSQHLSLIHGEVVNAFRYSFLILGCLTLLSSFIFRRLQPQDGRNLTLKSQAHTAKQHEEI